MEGSVLVHELRKVITLVDLLRDIGLDKQLSLPKVVVLGNQSSGKSSLLQQIVGLDFLPRGSGVVTRRPLQLRMNNIPGLKAPYAEFDQIVEGGKKKRFTNFSQVRKSIDQVTDKLCGSEKVIKDIPIVLNIFSSTCPNLTIVDLPGITSIPVGKQPKNIYQVTRDMALRYVNQKRSIILCVIPANQDLSTSQALKLMRQIDPRGERSIGCLTKIDIMNRGDDASKILKNQQIPLRYGYVGIKNRCQQDVINNVPVTQSLKSERQFFTKSPIYSTLPPDTFGTQSLTKKLTNILYQQIKSSMPQIFEEIKRKKAESQQQLQKLGPGIASTDGQMVNYAWKSISAFMRIFNNSIQGIKNSDYTGDPISSQIRQQLTNLYKQQYDEPATSQLRDKDIQKAMINFPGDNIPGFPSIDAFLALLNPLLKKLQTPAYSINNRVHQIMQHESSKIISQIMIKKFPQFNDRFTDLVRKVLQRHRKDLQSYLNFLLDSQLSYLYTNDALYLTGQFGLTDKEKKKVQTGKIKDPLIFELRKRIDSYYKLVVRNLRDLVPKQVFNFLIVKCMKQLQFQAFQFTSDVNKLKQLLNQPQQIRSRRKQCVKAIKVFEQSQKRIRMDPDISKLIKNTTKQSKYYKKYGMKSPQQQQQQIQKINQKQNRQKDIKRQQQIRKKQQYLKQQQLAKQQEARRIQAQKQQQAKQRKSPSQSTNSNSSKVSNDSVFSMFGTNPKQTSSGQQQVTVTLPSKQQIKQGQKVMQKASQVGVGVTITSPNPKKTEKNFADLFGDTKGSKQQPQQPQQPKQTVQVPPTQQPGNNTSGTNGKQPEQKKQRTATFNNLFGLK